MAEGDGIRPGEIATDLPGATDAGVYFIGRIRTPYKHRDDCPRQGSRDGPECRIEVFERWVAALADIERSETLEILYWLDRSRRDLVLQNPGRDGVLRGTFSLRSPVRPNPIGTAIVTLVAVEGRVLTVRGLDCLDGTPLIDIKPDRCQFAPQAPPKEADRR